MSVTVSARAALARAVLSGAVLTAIAGVLAPAFTRAQVVMRPALAAPALPTIVATDSTPGAPFASSLTIMPPGPRAESDGLTFGLRLNWSPRTGAAAYRIFTWTDAARAWYRAAQTSATRVDVHAFRSGCTAFVVIAIANPTVNGKPLSGLDTTNVLRFPLSAHPELCPARPE